MPTKTKRTLRLQLFNQTKKAVKRLSFTNGNNCLGKYSGCLSPYYKQESLISEYTSHKISFFYSLKI